MMIDRENVIKGLQCIIDGNVRCVSCGYAIDKHGHYGCQQECAKDAIALLKEQEKKRIALHKKHGITWRRNDEFSMRNLYEAICETLLDEGELFISRMDNHDRVDFVFYITESR